jgi:hypothetical protein
MLRGNITTLLQSVVLEGITTPTSSEYFAISADAHLALGHITPADYTCDTPDRKEKNRDFSLQRLARVVCADLDEIGKQGALQIAGQFWEHQRALICGQVRCIAKECGTGEIIVAGMGSSLFAHELDGTDLNEKLGPVAEALPAFAVREIAMRGGYL